MRLTFGKKRQGSFFPAIKVVVLSLSLLVAIGVYSSSGIEFAGYLETLELAASSPVSRTATAITVAPDPIDICFITSIFGADAAKADQPHDVSGHSWGNETSFKFFLYTNMEEMEAPGWTKVIRNFQYRRYITQSRWGKFMAWKDAEIQGCKTVFYQDGHYAPNRSRKKFVELAASIHNNEHGMAQKLVEGHGGRPPLTEFRIIRALKKDIPKNIEASIAWLEAQPDFYNNSTLYENCYFGYDPNNVNFQRTTQYFWDHYSKEEDSWRDQPFWSYAMYHNDMHPLKMGKGWFRADNNKKGHGGHKYTAESDSDASAPTAAVTAAAAPARKVN